MTKTIVRRKVPDSNNLSDSYHPVLRQIYTARNILHTSELDYSLKGLLPFQGLHGMDQAVSMLVEALDKHKRILIVADYDVDGATSCALAMRGLALMGATNLHYVVPDRFEFGYGLSPEIVEVAAQQQPDILLTVDNGISSIDGVRLARAKGIDVLITDHHLPGAQLPDANAIVNPNQDGDTFASKCLAGVGVMFYLLAGLRATLRERGWFNKKNIAEPNLADLLDLVALGTIADVVPLDHNNRILVAQGLQRIRRGKCVAGIKALLQVANRTITSIKASDLGFSVGPRLNAAGRLTDMGLGIECLLSDDPQQALDMAVTLNDINKQRREIQKDMQALADIEMLALEAGPDLPFGLCLYNKEWHQGVIGILASKIKDKWCRPVIAFAKDSNGMIKGSARSIVNVHIKDVLDSIATREPGLIDKFGGHAMAAGLTINENDFIRFKSAFETELLNNMTAEDLEDVLITDGDLPANDIKLSLAELIHQAGPWGQGFPEPVFDGVFEVANRRIVGQYHLKMTLTLPGSQHKYDAIAFFTDDETWPAQVDTVQLVYRLDINEYQGRKKLQFIVDYVEPMS